jgi:hypothetical protein
MMIKLGRFRLGKENFIMELQATPEVQKRWDSLGKDIEAFKKYYFRRRRMNYITYAILILLGLSMAVAITIAGIFNQGVIAAILGVGVGFIQGIQQVFPMGEKAEFYRLIVAESENLIADLRYKTTSENDFQSVLQKYQTLRIHAATSIPRGQGMETVKKMYDDLASRKSISPISEVVSSGR